MGATAERAHGQPFVRTGRLSAAEVGIILANTELANQIIT